MSECSAPIVLNIMLMRRLVPHFVPSYGLITNNTKVFIKIVLKSLLPIMLALRLMLSETYYAQNYAGIYNRPSLDLTS